MQLYDHGAALAKKGACCAGLDIHDARRVAEEMGFPHYVLDYENVFKDAVIDEFADSYLRKLRPEAAAPGNIVDVDGRVLATHDGVVNFTIGQRRGLGIGGLATPLYVIKLDAQTRQVVVGPKSMLSTRTVPVREINWLGDEPLQSRDEWHLAVKVRSTRPPTDAIIRPISETEATVELTSPEEGVSPGQACVFYDTDSSRIYGGGWIHKG